MKKYNAATAAAGSNPRRYVFDSVFGHDDSQSEVFSHLMLADGLIQHVVDGYDACVFSFGQNKKGFKINFYPFLTIKMLFHQI
jgi:hypothetical protein